MPSLLQSLLTSYPTATSRILKRNEFLLQEGQIEHHLYLIESGAVRVFYLTELEEHTIRFGYQNSIINSLASFLKGTPSEFYIQAIRKTAVRVFPKSFFRSFTTANLQNLQQYNQLLETLVTQQIEREIDLLTPSPIERLKRVQARSPQLFQEIPAKYIASYLRMSPETLSRIRNS